MRPASAPPFARVVSAASLSFLMLATTAVASEVERRHRPYSMQGLDVFRLELPIAAVTLRPHRGSAIEVEMAIECTGDLIRCREAAGELALSPHADGERLVLSLGGPEKYAQKGLSFVLPTSITISTPKKGTRSRQRERRFGGKHDWQLAVELVLLYPALERLELAMTEGSVKLEQLATDLDLSLASGAVEIGLERSAVGKLELVASRVVATGLDDAPRQGKTVSFAGEGAIDVSARVEKGQIILRAE